MRTLILLVLIALVFPVSNSFAGLSELSVVSESDTSGFVIAVPFDLRERESYFQVTNVFSINQNFHVQIYNVGNLCNENNFFDDYTPNDTHIYNLRDIQTNDGNPSGIVLPDDAYGIIIVTAPLMDFEEGTNPPIIGNFRILDNLGYEYRSNAVTEPTVGIEEPEGLILSFNYNSEAGVVLSDVFGIALSFTRDGDDNDFVEATLDDVVSTFVAVDVDIINNNEVLFSCRDVIFSCVDENNPLIEEILELASGEVNISRSSASVARFEYGINNTIPNSKDSELLCPGNIIPEGIVILTPENIGEETVAIIGYVGLNNGNGRGSMDSFSYPNVFDENDE